MRIEGGHSQPKVRREMVSQYFTDLDRNAFRHVIGHFMSGVAVITCRNGDELTGMTASAVSSVSLDPPMVLVCLNQSTSTQQAVLNAGAFAVNILHQDQGDLAQHFARFNAGDKFEDVEITYGVLGQPLLDDALATLECEVEAEVTGGTHRVFLAGVVHANTRPGEPLAYFRGEFGRLLRSREHAIYEELRNEILHSRLEVGAQLSAVQVAAESGAPTTAVVYALNRLSSEGLVQRDRDGSFTVCGAGVELARSVIDARLAIEKGAATAILEHLDGEDLARLGDRLEAIEETGREHSSPAEAGRLLRRDADLHEQLIAIAGNSSLLDAFRGLTIPELASGAAREKVGLLLADDRRILAALSARDLTLLNEALTSYAERRKEIAVDDEW